MKAAGLSLNEVLFAALPAAISVLNLCPNLQRSQR